MMDQLVGGIPEAINNNVTSSHKRMELRDRSRVRGTERAQSRRGAPGFSAATACCPFRLNAPTGAHSSVPTACSTSANCRSSRSDSNA